MLELIQQNLETCLICKIHGGPNPQVKYGNTSPNLPFNVVSIDLVGPMPMAISGHCYILIAVSHLTKCVEAS